MAVVCPWCQDPYEKYLTNWLVKAMNRLTLSGSTHYGVGICQQIGTVLG